MSQVILYKRADGGISIVYPVPEVVAAVGIEAIAVKDVPEGCRFKIIDESALPADKSLQHLWLVDDSDLDTGVGAESSEFPPDLRELLP
jgi:hypothetical protein